MTDIRAIQWRDGSRGTDYPFVDGAPLANAAGDRIPADLIDDALIHPAGGGAGAYLMSVEVSDAVVLRIGDPTNGGTCRAVWDPADPADDLELLDAFGRPAGILVGRSEKWAALRTGLVGPKAVFRPEETPFAASVCVPVPSQGLDGILLEDGTVLTGEVWLVGENGVVLSLQDGVIAVDAVGDPYHGLRECVIRGEPPAIPCPVKTISRIKPDAAGDWKLTVGILAAADPALRIEPDGDGLLVRTVGKGG